MAAPSRNTGFADDDISNTITNTCTSTPTLHRETRTASDSTTTSHTPCLRYQTPQTMLPHQTPQTMQDLDASLSLHECIARYSKAITWSVLISLTLIMEGYSTILVPNLYSLGPFLRQFGTRQPNGDYEISAAWQSALVNGALAGQILGLFLAGWLAERIGYRRTLMVGLVAATGFISIMFLATTKVVLLVGLCLLGAPWGVFQTISTTYAVDILPVRLRGYLTTYVNACWVIGQLVASIVLRAMLSLDSQWAYRIPFGLQWAFPIPIFVVVALAPESPWWLVRQSRLEEAEHSLRRLRKQTANETDTAFTTSLQQTLAQIVTTNNNEKKAQSGTRFLDCFKGTDRRRTEIACMVWIIQILCGSTFMGFSTYFYEQAGLSAAHAFTMSLAQFALSLLGVLFSWTLLSHLGRRTIYLSGQTLTLLCMTLIGIIACIPSSSRALPWSIAALLLLFTAIYNATLGPVCYTLVAEVPSTRLRSKTIVIARNAYNVFGIATNLVTPRMLNPTAWDWGARSAWFWVGMGVVGVVWSWGRLPETGGRTFGEIDGLFRMGVKARGFGGTRVEVEGEVDGNGAGATAMREVEKVGEV